MMPVKGGKSQKRVNEGGESFNLEGRNSNLDLSLQQHYGLLGAAGLDTSPTLEELDELEALLEREQELLCQHPTASSSINLFQSPDRSLRLPVGAGSHQSHTPRTVPRTYGCNSVPLNQLTSIILNMTFSDAEEDHQGTTDGRERANSSAGNDGDNSDRERSLSRSRTESGVSNASTVSPPALPPTPPPPINGELGEPSSSSGRTALSEGATGTSVPTSSVNQEDLTNKLLDMKTVDSKKIMEKLQQIQGYIQQTSTAMAALEQQGDLGNIGQYNTLVKVMKDLKDSEIKLKGHLDATLKSEGAAAQVVNGVQNDATTSESPANGVAETTAINSGSAGNQIVGIVHPSNVQGLSLQERLAASQVESSAIMTRMRDSIARREDLMTRYKATRERLENLKKQRQDMREEQRRLTESAASSTTDASEDPVPGAETWSNEDIANSIVEFQVLFDKVDRIQDIYTAKSQSLDPGDEEGHAHIANKMEQVLKKRKQLIDALTKLRQIQRSREEEVRDAEDPPRADTQPSSTTTVGETNSVRTSGESDSNQLAGRDMPILSDNAASASGILSQQNANESENIDLSSTVSRVGRINEEVSSKQSELATLQRQFSDMKKLLDTATAARKEEEERMIASKKRLEEAQALLAESRRVRQSNDELIRTTNEEGAVGGEIVGVSGRRLQLSEAEMQNPVLKSKYQDIAKAKQRLAKLEDVMSMISTAQKNRQDIRDVLPPEYMALLEEAESEYPSSNRRKPQPADVPIIEEESDDEIRASRRYQRSTRRGSAGRGEISGSLGRSERDRYSRDEDSREIRDRHAREQENREISAMQKRLNKTTSRISSVNEGYRHGYEKGAIKKQPQALWQERNTSVDPRMTEVIALQEELKQKKNALEALMRRMGKSSSLNMDNISDNISDNVSDNASDRMDGGTTATWGTGALHDYSDNHYRQSSDEDLIEGDDVEAIPQSHRRSQPPPLSGPPKDRNHYSLGSGRHRRRQDSGQFSVNNLATAPPSGRSKHNRFRGGSVPKASWEPAPVADDRNYKSPSNTTLQAQQSIGAVLSQLSQVQGTINNLHETLRHEQNQLLGQVSIHSQAVPHMLPDLPTPSLPSSSLSHLPGVGMQALTPMSSYAGLGSLALGTSDANSQQMAAMVQQCISQLQLHSLEIQALSKHLQVRHSPFFPPYFPPYH
ncbi:hypothetical protein SK128_025799 [Halocaridina rubra]|uniref:Uncharacterized protein n=1 Tax=Halocaridina rubra TaxID=373956 RepID=A0AAN8X8U2_HALRR